jgi:hypothetical protein
MANDQFLFPFGWYSFELGSYRSCRGAYCCYPYETLPPLEQAFTGTFAWLAPLAEGDHPMRNIVYSSPAEEHRDMLAVLAQLTQDAQQREIDLPAPFLTFMRSAELRQRVPSVTGCFFDLSGRLVPCPERDGYIVRFLNDSQSVVTWFLYLSATRAPCVIGTGGPLDQWDDPDYFPDDEEAREAEKKGIVAATRVCAMTFESFLYRFWFENVLWMALSRKRSLDSVQERYLQHLEATKSG